MNYTSVKVTDIKAVKESILVSIKNKPNLKFPCRGMRGSNEIPESVQCGSVKADMMKLCQSCLQTYEAATNQVVESIPLMAAGNAENVENVEEGGQNSQKPSSVVSRLITWVRNHKALTGIAALGGIGLVAGITTASAVAAKQADSSLGNTGVKLNASFGSIIYSPSDNQQSAKKPEPEKVTPPSVQGTARSKPEKVTTSSVQGTVRPKLEKITTPRDKEPNQAKVTTPKQQLTEKPIKKPIEKPKQPSAKKFPCSSFGELQFHAPANTNLTLKLSDASFAQFSAGENSRIDLNMQGLCPEGQSELWASFLASCGNKIVELLPADILSQKALNAKLDTTACKSSIETSLIFTGKLNQGLFLDKDKMCDEGMIQGFQVKTNKALVLFSLPSKGQQAKSLLEEENFDESYHIYDVTMPSEICKELFDNSILVECMNTDKSFASATITPKTSLTKVKINDLDLGGCAVKASDATLPRKICTLKNEVEFNSCVDA